MFLSYSSNYHGYWCLDIISNCKFQPYHDIRWVVFPILDSANGLNYSTGQPWGTLDSSFLYLLPSSCLTSITNTWSIASCCTLTVSSEADTSIHTDSSQVVPNSNGIVAYLVTRTHHMVTRARDCSLPPRDFLLSDIHRFSLSPLMDKNLAPIWPLRRILVGLPLCKTNIAHCLTNIRGTLFHLLLIKRLLAANGSTKSNRSLMDW